MKPPTPADRLILELQDRAVKALDICNAITHAIDLVCHWQKLSEIVVSLVPAKNRTNFRSLSLSFSKSWSSAKQIQSMTANLVAPRGGETTGLVLPVYIIMSTILVFAMWALVAALPCQERNGLATHFQVLKQLTWAQSIIWMQEKIGEEWKKKEKKGTGGLLEETQRMERVALNLVEFAEGFQFLMEAEKAEEVAAQVAEMAEICSKMEEGLGPLQQQVRGVS